MRFCFAPACGASVRKARWRGGEGWLAPVADGRGHGLRRRWVGRLVVGGGGSGASALNCGFCRGR